LVAQNDIVLQFYLDPNQIALTRDANWLPVFSHEPTPGRIYSRTKKLRSVEFELEETLWMPMRLRLNMIDFLRCAGRAHPRIEAINGPGPELLPDDHVPCPFLIVPVLHMARWGLWTLRRAALKGEEMLLMADQGDLVFRVQGAELVEVQLRAEPIRSVVPPADLMTAWELFSEEVRTQFLAELPELVDHAEYGPWFREGLDYLRRQPI
jgi:hypothetical protein